MAATNDSVHNRLELAQNQLSPVQIASGLLFGAAIAFTLVFLQEPLAHDAMHNFRHAAGIACH